MLNPQRERDDESIRRRSQWRRKAREEEEEQHRKEKMLNNKVKEMTRNIEVLIRNERRNVDALFP